MKTTIKTLYQKGYNKTQIGQMLGIDRKTVRKVLKDDTNQNETGQGILESVWPSMLDEYRELTDILLDATPQFDRTHQ